MHMTTGVHVSQRTPLVVRYIGGRCRMRCRNWGRTGRTVTVNPYPAIARTAEAILDLHAMGTSVHDLLGAASAFTRADGMDDVAAIPRAVIGNDARTVLRGDIAACGAANAARGVDSLVAHLRFIRSQALRLDAATHR
jgi:hypothetical protein